MLGYFPKPQDDELLYSVIARFKIHHGITSDRQVVTKLFGSRDVAAVVDLPGHLKDLENNTYHLTRITAEQWLMGHTLYPAYQQFLPKERREKLTASVFEGRAWNVHTRIGHAAFALKSPKFLKICQVCFEQQLDIGGEPYWQRLFQMNGLYICPTHEEPLVTTNVPYRPKSKYAYIAAGEAHIGQTVLKNCNRGEMDALIRIGFGLAELLACHQPKVDSFDQWSAYYASLARQSDCLLSAARVNHAVVREVVETRWSRSLLVLFRLHFSRKANWLQNLFRKHRKTFHYLEHLTVWLALDGRPIREILNHVSTLRSTNVITKQSTKSAEKEKVTKKRNEWHLVQQSNPGKGVKWLRENVAAAIYAWLYRHDREWLLNNVPAKVKPVDLVQVVDWEARDALLLQKCKALRKKGMLVNQNGRTSKSWLIKQIDNSSSLEKNQQKLPETILYLASLAESIETYQRRRIVQVVTALYQKHEQIKIWMVYRKAGIRKVYQTPSLEKFIQSLVRKCLLGSARLFSKNSR